MNLGGLLPTSTTFHQQMAENAIYIRNSEVSLNNLDACARDALAFGNRGFRPDVLKEGGLSTGASRNRRETSIGIRRGSATGRGKSRSKVASALMII
jgi:hypothetical protein